MTLYSSPSVTADTEIERTVKMNNPAINTMTNEHILWANNMLEVQNEVLQQSCADLREVITKLKTENDRLKSVNAVLKITIQNITRRG